MIQKEFNEHKMFHNVHSACYEDGRRGLEGVGVRPEINTHRAAGREEVQKRTNADV